MSSGSDWILKASKELDDLVHSMEDAPEDAWRAAVLSARLLGAPDGPKPADALIARLPELIRVAGPPDCEALLSAFADELEAPEDPWGPLLDILLDVDDALGVLGLSDGKQEEALELATQVAALSSLYPERLMALTAFAQMRLETLGDASPIARVWRAVERAPAQLLADALPIPARPGAEALSRLASEHSWIGALYSKLRSMFDKSEAITAEILASIKPVGAMPDFAASLSASTDTTKELELIWGEFPRVELAVGESVELEVPPTCQLWYALSSGSSLFPEAKWVLERDESPVLIIATESSGAQTLEDALASSVRVAGLVLVESVDVVSNNKSKEIDIMKKKEASMQSKGVVTALPLDVSPKGMRRARDAWEATQYYQQQIQATPEGRQSNALREEGHRLKTQGDLAHAHERFVLAASRHAVDDESAAAAACWYDLGQSFTEIRTGVRKQNLMEAVRLLRRAEQATVRRADVRRHILSLDGLGRALRAVAAELHNEEALAEALQRLRKAVKLSREYSSATLDLLMNSLANLGNVLLQAGEVDEAIRVHEESLLIGEMVERDLPIIEQLMSEGLTLSLRRLNLARGLYKRGQSTDLQRAQDLVNTIVMSATPLDIIAQAYLMGYEIARRLGVSKSKLVTDYLEKINILQLTIEEQKRFIFVLRDEGEHERALKLARLCASKAIQERHDARADADADHCAAKAQGFSRLAAELLAEVNDPVAAFVALENTAAMRYFDAVTRYVWSPETPLVHTLGALHREASGWSAALDDLALRVAGVDPSLEGKRLHELFDKCLEHLLAQPKTIDFEWDGSAAQIQEVLSRAKHDNMPSEVLREHSRRLSDVTISLKEAIERLDPSQFKASEQAWSNEVSEEMIRHIFDEQHDLVLLHLSMDVDKLLAVSVWKEHDVLRGASKTFEIKAESVSALFLLARLETLKKEDEERSQAAMNAFLASIDLSVVLPKAPSHVIILPSQIASYVPWAACGPPDRMLIDVVGAVSYLPNLTPLFTRQAPWAPRSGRLLVAPGAACEHSTKFHGIAFSEPANDETPLLDAAATRAATGEHIASANVVSFFAHGSYNTQSPWGAIQLADGLFIPRECVNVWRGIERVELWACRTGVNVSYDPLTPWVDEGFGLDVDLHHLGVRSTIGTFWNVSDFVTALLVREYRRALARGQRAPDALADAQRWWRAEGLKQVRTALESGDPVRNLREQAASLGIDAALMDELVAGALGPVPKDNKIPQEEVDQQIRLWSSPIAWAGFRFLGVSDRYPSRELSPLEDLTSKERVLIEEILKRPRVAAGDDETFESMLSAATLEYVRTSPTTSQAIHAARLYATRRRSEHAQNLVRGLAWIHEALAAPGLDDLARVSLSREAAWLWFELATGEVPLSIRYSRTTAPPLFARAAAAIEALPSGPERTLLELGLASARSAERAAEDELYAIWVQMRRVSSEPLETLRLRCLLVSLILADVSCAPKQLATELTEEFAAMGACDEVALRWRAQYAVLLAKLLWRKGLEALPIPSLPPATHLPHALFLDRCEAASRALATHDDAPEELMLDILSNDLSLLEADLWGYRRDDGVLAWMATGSPGAGWQRFAGSMLSQVLAREPAQGREAIHFIASIHLGADLRMAPLVALSMMQGFLSPETRPIELSMVVRGRERHLSLLLDAAAMNAPESDVFSQGRARLLAAAQHGPRHSTGWLVEVALDKYQWGDDEPTRARTAAFDVERRVIMFDQYIAQLALDFSKVRDNIGAVDLPPWINVLTSLAAGPPRDLEALERKLTELPADVAVLGAFEGAGGSLLLGVVWTQDGQTKQAIHVVGELAGVKAARFLEDVQRLRKEDLFGESRGVSAERAQAWEALRCLLDEPLGVLLRSVGRRALRVLAPHSLRSLPWLGLTAGGEPLYAREAGVALLPFLGFEDTEVMRRRSQGPNTACILGGTLEHGETRFGEVVIQSLRRLLPHTQALEPATSPGTTIVEMDFIEENQDYINTLRIYGTGSPWTMTPSTEGLTLNHDRILMSRNFEDINLSACGCVELWAATEGVGATSRQASHHDALPSLVRVFIVGGAGGVIDLAWPIPDLVKALVCERFGLLRHGSRRPSLALALAVSDTAKLLADWRGAAASFDEVTAALAWLDARRREQASSFGLNAAAVIPFAPLAQIAGPDPHKLIEISCQPVHLAAFRWWGA